VPNLIDPLRRNRRSGEGIRWGNGVCCPHCGCFDGIKKLGGAAADKGLWHCKPCRKKFTVTVGTVVERSHIPLTKWLAAST
jgi:transposase-like protein